MQLSRKQIIIIGVIIFIVVPVTAYIIFLVVNKEKPEEEYLKTAVSIVRDKDTGQIIEEANPNLTPQTSETRSVTIIGAEALVQQKILTTQLNVIKDSIADYAKTKLDGKFKTVTIRSEGLVNNAGVITTTLRLGQSDEIVPMTVTALDTGETRVVIEDPTNIRGGTYDSGATYFRGD